MNGSWLVLLPPLIVIILAAPTQRIASSLLVGIFSALLILHNFSLTKAVPATFQHIFKTTELGTITSWQTFWSTYYLFICLFLLLLGIIITMLRYSGGAYAYGNFVMRYLKTAKHAQMSSLFLSLFFFVDDYFQCLMVGSVMQTVTDRFKVARTKLALLVNSMGAPLAVIAPVSSWAAQITMQLRQAGVSHKAQSETLILDNPFSLYLTAIPFLFYSLIIILSLWFVVTRNLSFGIIRKHEKIAQETGNLFAGKSPVTRRTKELSDQAIAQSSMLDFLVPIITLFGSVIINILYFGNHTFFGGPNTIVTALQTANTAAALFNSAVITLVVGCLFLLARKTLTLSQLPHICIEGLQVMGPSVAILILIWTLSNLLRYDLGTGNYLASLLLGHLNVHLLPVMFFLVAMFTASSIGSAWGSIGLLIPIALPMTVSLLHLQVPVTLDLAPIIYPLLGAIISGSVTGNHLSPISDTMLMSSTSAGAHHIDLVKTQYSFSIPTIFSTAIAFLVSGILAYKLSVPVNALICLCVGLSLNIAILSILHIRAHSKSANMS